MGSKRRFEFRKGFSLVGVLVALSLSAIVVMGLTDFFINVFRDQKRLNVLFQIQQVQRNISTFISSDDAWKSTILNNPSLDCLRPAAPPFVPPQCNNGMTGSLTLFTPAGASYFDPALQGFTLDGEICMKNDPKCKMTLNINVDLKCPGTPPAATCADPDQIVIRGTFQPFDLSAGNPFVFNANNYRINVVKEDFALAAAAGGGIAFQLKCPWVIMINFMPQPQSLPPGVCVPPTCPPGFIDGGISVEVTGTHGNLHAVGNVIRNCFK